mgnify:CR=1 FL=1
MKALLYTEDEDNLKGKHIPFYFNEEEIKGYYEPLEFDGIKYFNILINSTIVTLVQNKQLKEYLENTFKDD